MEQTKIKTMFFKFLQNTFAYALPIFMQQFIMYPIIADKLGASKNGLFLSLLAINYFTINITVSVLVNTRLLQNEKYKEKQYVGDYNLILLLFVFINILIVTVGTIFYTGRTATKTDIILSIVLMVLMIYHDYITVQYRIELKFNKILINNIFLCLGYVIGLILFSNIIMYWQIVFIVAYGITFIYDMLNTNYIREPLKVTPLMRDTLHQYFLLMASTLLTTAVTYGDRLLLYPILDGTSVSVFSSAQLIGKMMQMLSTPITTFVLAYLVRKDEMRITIRLKTIGYSILGLVVLYVACIIVSYPMIRFLYPGWAEESLKYVRITALNGIILMLAVIINVFVLRFCDKRYQIIKSAIYLVTYLGFSFGLVKIMGLWGFCFGNLISAVFQLIYLIFILLKKQLIKIQILEKK